MPNISLAQSIRFMHGNVSALPHADQSTPVIARYLCMVDLALASFCDQRQQISQKDLFRANDYTIHHLQQTYQKSILNEFYNINHFAINDYFKNHLN